MASGRAALTPAVSLTDRRCASCGGSGVVVRLSACNCGARHKAVAG
jgi:hypothetical protein